MKLMWLASSLVVLGCSSHKRPAEPSRHYVARGQIVTMRTGAIDIHHERMPAVEGFSGKVGPMESMTMPFAPTEGVAIDQLAIGDPVRFTFEVHYDEEPTLRLIDIEKLPSTTKLELP